MPPSLEQRCRNLLQELGMLSDKATVSVDPLTGGVASDIARVSIDGQVYCIKFALPKLRVAADWFAPVERNLAEYRWLQTVAKIEPQSSLKLYGHSLAENGFAMEYLDGADTYLLKPALFEGKGKPEEAKAIGLLLGQIHATSAQPDFDPSPFQNRDDFFAIRIEPYLVHTALAHPGLGNALHSMADQLYAMASVLVHGDVSPKNIMFRAGHPYILDAECATMGDGCFDLAFCMNHFILKSIYRPSCQDAYLGLCSALWEAYVPWITFEDPAALEARVCRLLPMLMLARVDGKSPVEYLDPVEQDLVRQLSIPLIETPATELAGLLSRLKPIMAEEDT